MTANTPASRRYLKFDLARVDARVVMKDEYKKLPGLTADMLKRATVRKGSGQPDR